MKKDSGESLRSASQCFAGNKKKEETISEIFSNLSSAQNEGIENEARNIHGLSSLRAKRNGVVFINTLEFPEIHIEKDKKTRDIKSVCFQASHLNACYGNISDTGENCRWVVYENYNSETLGEGGNKSRSGGIGPHRGNFQSYAALIDFMHQWEKNCIAEYLQSKEDGVIRYTPEMLYKFVDRPFSNQLGGTKPYNQMHWVRSMESLGLAVPTIEIALQTYPGKNPRDCLRLNALFP